MKEGKSRISPPAPAEPPWLLLVYQLPSQPSNARVKTWRRLQKLGARAIRNSAYLLPNSAQAREDFEWLKTEIISMKGQADVFTANTVDTLSSDDIISNFRSERQRDFEVIRRGAASLLERAGRGRKRGAPLCLRLARAARALRGRWGEVVAVDFFGAPGRDEAAAVLDQIDRALSGAMRRPSAPAQEGGTRLVEKFRDRTWITRPRPGIDRMSSAWLIRRFIDPRARFRFLEKPDKSAASVPFDMFGVEFSHQGNFCTFETLAWRFGISSPAVEWLGRIVHDIDLKDARYLEDEAPAVDRLVDGMRRVYSDDYELLERGIAMFEALYRSFDEHAKSPARPRSRLVRSKPA
jgi:hypothetical protein